MQIYLITNKVNGKVYVGKWKKKSLGDRWKLHVLGFGKQSRMPISRAIRKHGAETFDIRPLHAGIADAEILDMWEKIFIAAFRSNDPAAGYNATDGGSRGYRWNIVSRERRSESQRGSLNCNFGRPRSDRARAAISAALKGKPFTPEHRAALKRRTPGFLGKTLSEEARRKIGEASRVRAESRDLSGANNPMFGKKRDLHGEKNPMFGKRMSPGARAKIAAASRAWWAKKKSSNP